MSVDAEDLNRDPVAHRVISAEEMDRLLREARERPQFEGIVRPPRGPNRAQRRAAARARRKRGR